MILVNDLGLTDYRLIWNKMKHFTLNRTASTLDECWLLEHNPVYTQGQAGKPEHLLNPTSIPVIQSDRGGQITYHGPGQLVCYVLMDIKRQHLGIRDLVSVLENLIIELLKNYDINAQKKDNAPGVYVEEAKIASIGLRVKNGYTYHGIAINCAMDLSPFLNINPCGYAQMKMVQIQDFYRQVSLNEVKKQFGLLLLSQFNA